MPPPAWWDVTWATWALVVIGFVGTLVALWTLRSIVEQTKASKASTDALINSERAWVLVELDKMPGVVTSVSSITYNFRIRSTNNGGTPAWITEKRARMVVVEVLPATPNWDDPGFIDPELEPLAVGGKTETKNVELSCSGREDGKMVVVYGIVKYRDVFRPERTTTFGYRVSVDGVLTRLTGYPKYNQNT